MLLATEEQKKVAVIVNALIDIPLVPEDVEQVIFEHAVAVIDTALEGVLPEAFNTLLRDRSRGIDKDHARVFADRLVQAVNKKIDLPYLDEEQEDRLLRVVIDPIVKSMIVGKSLDDLLPDVT